MKPSTIVANSNRVQRVAQERPQRRIVAHSPGAYSRASPEPPNLCAVLIESLP
jgi:hypothetical protein